jgi:hypothetical protein
VGYELSEGGVPVKERATIEEGLSGNSGNLENANAEEVDKNASCSRQRSADSCILKEKMRGLAI